MEQHWEVPEADVEVYNHRFKLAEFSDKERDTGLTEVSEAAVESRWLSSQPFDKWQNFGEWFLVLGRFEVYYLSAH